MAFLPNQRHVISGGTDGRIILWDRQTGREVARKEGLGHLANAVVPLPDGRHVVSFGGWYDGEELGPGLAGSKPSPLAGDNAFRLWLLPESVWPGPASQPLAIEEIHRLQGHTDEIRDLAFFDDGAKLATSSADQTFRVWDVKAGKELYKRDCPHWVSSLAISPDGKLAALGYITGTPVSELEIVNLATKQRLHYLAGPPQRVERLAFSPDGQRLLSTGTEGWGTMWNVATGKKIYQFRQDEKRLWDGTFSPDGRQILTASSGPPQLVLRDAADGKLIREFISPQRRAVVTARFSRDGGRIVAATAGTDIPIYDTTTGKRVQTIASPSGTTDVRFWNGDKSVIASGNDNVLRIFDTQSGQLLSERSLKNAVGKRLALSPDETVLATGGGIAKQFIANDATKRLSAGRRDYAVQLWRLPAILP
jgi:WD40 repeat protein